MKALINQSQNLTRTLDNPRWYDHLMNKIKKILLLHVNAQQSKLRSKCSIIFFVIIIMMKSSSILLILVLQNPDVFRVSVFCVTKHCSIWILSALWRYTKNDDDDDVDDDYGGWIQRPLEITTKSMTFVVACRWLNQSHCCYHCQCCLPAELLCSMRQRIHWSAHTSVIIISIHKSHCRIVNTKSKGDEGVRSTCRCDSKKCQMPSFSMYVGWAGKKA